MSSTCYNCLHWRLNIQPAAYQGTCMHFQDSTGRYVQMRANDFCSRHIEVETCHKEPTDATYVLLTMLVKQVAELRAEVILLRDNIVCADRRSMDHTLDTSVHLRRPI